MKKLLTLTLVVLSVIVFASFSSSAKSVNLGETFEISYNQKNQEYSFNFTATESICYEIALDTPLPKDTYVSTYDASGKEIGFDYWDGTTSKCLSAVDLKAGSTYTIIITCETEENVIVSAKMDKHSHLYTINSIDKADDVKAGYVERECTVCEYHEKAPIAKVNIALSKNSFVFSGKAQTPAVTVTDTNGKTFDSKDYTVTYPESRVNVGSYSVIIEMKNDYYNVYEILSYEINAKDISKFEAKIADKTVSYGDKVAISFDGLTKGVDFEYNAPYDDIGPQKAVIYGKGNYTGIMTVSYNVVPCDVVNLKVAKVTANSVKLTWKADKNDETDYYQIYDVTAKKVIATIDEDTLTYTVKGLKAGTAYSFKVRGLSKEDGKNYYGDYSTVNTATKTAATTFKSLSSTKAKTFIAKWNAKSGVTGYQIQYATAADFANAKTVKVAGASATSKTVSSLKSGKKYYVRVRTYKTLKVDGKSTTVYSDWSKASAVKVK